MQSTRLAALAATVLVASPALAFDITTPGEIVPAGAVGIVNHDLVCDPPMVGVQLESGAKLFLNGKLLDGCSVSVASPSPTERQRIKVFGPGEIRNAGIHLRAGTLRVNDVVITDAPLYGIVGSGDAGDGPSKVNLSNVTITGSAFRGVSATNVRVRNVTANNNGVTLTGSGIWAPGGLRGRGLIATGNSNAGAMAVSGRVKLREAQLTDNGCIGIAGEKMLLVNSTVTGNDQANLGCVDVVSGLAPRLRNTTCGTSSDANLPANTWGVCSND